MTKTPIFDGFMKQLGAEQLNFRKWMIKEHKGSYYTETALFVISKDGELSCTDEKYMPDDDLLSSIEKELSRVVEEFPKSVMATKPQVKKKLSELKPSKCWPLYSRQEKGVSMIQERRETKEGKKYIAWSFWSDGKWRAMEPDTALSFYKPEKPTSNKIMIHEGAKAAEAAANLKKGHPWLAYMSEFDHWGLIGGALAPHRANYDELIKEGPVEVVYMADNDGPGRNSLQGFSRNWGRSLVGIVFNQSFPPAWDIADDIPKSLFAGKLYVGPEITSFARPATWATKVLPADGKGRPATVLREEFVNEWVHTVTPEVFIHRRWPSRILSAEQFNSEVAPFSHLKDTAGHVRRHLSGKETGLRYDPSMPQGAHTGREDKGSFVNVYQPTEIKPLSGSAKPFLDYMERVFPNDQDREHLLKWCATLIARPDIRMTYSVLLISKTQGAGKTTLGEKILAPLVGKSNVSFPREKDITETVFNGWMARKRLIVVGEIYAGKSLKAYNQLKQIASDRQIEVNEKYQAGYTLDNWAHVIASSNSFRALKIDRDDRRWLVPEVTETKQPQEFWIKFNRWLEVDGLPIIMGWAKDYAEKHGSVKTGEHAPATSLRDDMATGSESASETVFYRLLETLKNKHAEAFKRSGGESFIWTTDQELHRAIGLLVAEDRANQYRETVVDVRNSCKGMGLFVGKKHKGCPDLRIQADNCRVVSVDKKTAETTPQRLNANGGRFFRYSDLIQIYEERHAKDM